MNIWSDLTAGPRIFCRHLESPVWHLCFNDLGMLDSVEAANQSTCTWLSHVTWAFSHPGSFRVVGFQHRRSGFQRLMPLQTKQKLHCLEGPASEVTHHHFCFAQLVKRVTRWPKFKGEKTKLHLLMEGVSKILPPILQSLTLLKLVWTMWKKIESPRWNTT